MARYVDRYKPQVYGGNAQMDALYAVERSEAESLHKSVGAAVADLYPVEMGIDAVRRWEEVFRVESPDDFDLDTRRSVLLNKFRSRVPFTRQRLREILENIWGQGNFVFEIFPNEFRVIIDIYSDEPRVYLEFIDQVRLVIPANLYLILSIQYTNMYLRRNYTYGKMKELTYGELSRYVEHKTPVYKTLYTNVFFNQGYTYGTMKGLLYGTISSYVEEERQ